jgi:hypothetical protein
MLVVEREGVLSSDDFSWEKFERLVYRVNGSGVGHCISYGILGENGVGTVVSGIYLEAWIRVM